MISCMTTQPVCPNDTLSTKTLGKLGSELGADSVNTFITNFESMWPTRVSRLISALATRDVHAGEDAALSLRTAATMAGAKELAQLALLLHSAFRHENVTMQCELIEQIKQAGFGVLQILTKPGFAEQALKSYLQDSSD